MWNEVPAPAWVDVHDELFRVPPRQHLVAGLPDGPAFRASRRPRSAFTSAQAFLIRA
jgi:hypothetical protein